MNTTEAVRETLVLSLLGLIIFYFIILLYDTIARPWRLVEEQLMEIEMHIETLRKGGRRAKFHSWISMPAWRGDVEKHLKYLLGLRELKKAELELFEKLRR
ncbi:hypothetical protein E3E26_06995 [Thermococcus sp. LS1]|uniref:hypothetical protein n=1 Tax=Thermococcus sp. LS1 TaxID=1638259 RepID=UPI0014399B84|nr:hypothetical protein [Thermococcus sp. LS1]NJD99529.1 hypothetical protein [Thermococcus sp. LS1]